MAKMIAMLNQKGKTTIANNLAHSFQLINYKTLLLDNDPQVSAKDWNEINEVQIIPVVGLDKESLSNDVNAVKSGYGYIIVGPIRYHISSPRNNRQ